MAKIDKKLNDYYVEYAKNLNEEQPLREHIRVEDVPGLLKEEWGQYGDRGYGIFGNGEGFSGVLCICRIDEMDIYDGDIDAAHQAVKDGVKLIPWKEQPQFYPFRYYRFLSTPANRAALKREAERLRNG